MKIFIFNFLEMLTKILIIYDTSFFVYKKFDTIFYRLVSGNLRTEKSILLSSLKYYFKVNFTGFHMGVSKI